MLSEQYKNFPESYFSDTYKVSNFGNIKNSKSNILLKTNIFKNYVCIIINNKTYRVDKLVAECFIDKSDLYLVHIDGDKTNNMVSNLLFKNTHDYLKDLYGDEWKQIKEFNDYYISSTGKVWSLFSERLLTFSPSYGYYRVNLGGKKNSKKKHVHRLVAEAFIDNINNYPVVNHKNGIKTDCSVNNLEWVTHSENSLHSIYELGNTNHSTQSTAICEVPTDYLPLAINDNYLITKVTNFKNDMTNSIISTTSKSLGEFIYALKTNGVILSHLSISYNILVSKWLIGFEKIFELPDYQENFGILLMSYILSFNTDGYHPISNHVDEFKYTIDAKDNKVLNNIKTFLTKNEDISFLINLLILSGFSNQMSNRKSYIGLNLSTLSANLITVNTERYSAATDWTNSVLQSVTAYYTFISTYFGKNNQFGGRKTKKNYNKIIKRNNKTLRVKNMRIKTNTDKSKNKNSKKSGRNKKSRRKI